MPFMDGYEATSEIRKMLKPFNTNTKIIGVTGHVEQEYVDKAMEAG